MTKATHILAMLLATLAFAGVLVTAIVAIYFGRDLHAEAQLIMHGQQALRAHFGTHNAVGHAESGAECDQRSINVSEEVLRAGGEPSAASRSGNRAQARRPAHHGAPRARRRE